LGGKSKKKKTVTPKERVEKKKKFSRLKNEKSRKLALRQYCILSGAEDKEDLFLKEKAQMVGRVARLSAEKKTNRKGKGRRETSKKN